MRICVIGAGAVGAAFGGRLAFAGHDVVLVDTWAEHIAAINDNGLRIDGVLGEVTVTVAARVDGAGVVGQDLALVATDANSTGAAAQTASEVLAPGGVALTVQNGIGNVEALSDALGPGRVLGGSTMSSFRTDGPGWVTVTHAGPTTIGPLAHGQGAIVERTAEAMAGAGFEVRVSADVRSVIWAKFLLNLAINPLCAATFLRLGEIARHPEMSRFQDRILDEAFAVTRAKGLALDLAAIRAGIRAHCRSKYSKPSMLQHLERGRRTEIDALNAALVREANALGIATPYNEALVAIIKGCEVYHARRAAGVELDEVALEAAAAAEAAQISS